MGEPSLKVTRVYLLGGMPDCATEYIRGRNSRREYRERQGHRYGPLRAMILNHDLHYSFHLDPEAKVYTAMRVNDLGIPVDAKPRHMEWKPSGRTRHYHIETVDTGKRRQMFGRTARRVTTRTTLMMEPPGDSPVTESETAGWYIDPPAAWLLAHPPRDGFVYSAVTAAGQVAERDDARFTTAGPREAGFPLVLTHSPGRRREEVTELSEDSLDPGLFVPSADFERVPQLPPGLFGRKYPFGLRVRMRWAMLKDRLRAGAL